MSAWCQNITVPRSCGEYRAFWVVIETTHFRHFRCYGINSEWKHGPTAWKTKSYAALLGNWLRIPGLRFYWHSAWLSFSGGGQVFLLNPLTTLYSLFLSNLNFMVFANCDRQFYALSCIFKFVTPKLCRPWHLLVWGWYMIYKLFVVAWPVGVGVLWEKLAPLGAKQTDCWCNDVEHSQHVVKWLACLKWPHDKSTWVRSCMTVGLLFRPYELRCWSVHTGFPLQDFVQQLRLYMTCKDIFKTS